MMQSAAASTTPHRPAWDAAEAYGIDMNQVEAQLNLTPAERIQRHRKALAVANMLIAAVKESHG